MLLVAAFDPWAVGNGSSMRARRWCDALQLAAGSFDAVVVPVVASDAASPYRRLVLPDDAAKVRNAALLLQPRWRDWMVRTAPLPPLAERAPAWMGRELLTGLPWRPDLVVAFKLAVAPMAADLAMECEVPLVVDLDDDEVALAQLDGNSHAPALERLQRGVGELAGVLTVASPVDAEAVRERVAAPVHVVPNCVYVPEPCPEPGEPGGALYVANFGYAPNREAADWFRSQVLPLVRGLRELAVVGAGGERVGFGGVARAHGRVAQLDPFYREASVVVCPLLRGSGTSIKVVEALAHGRAVVTTTVGARGLGLVPGEHAVVCDDPREFADHVGRLLAHPDDAEAMGARGRALVAARYSAPAGATAMAGAAAAALGR